MSNNMKHEIGENIQIHCYKHNGKIHRIWEESTVIEENEEYLSDAIYNGVSGEAVNSTLEDVAAKADELGKTPVQLKESVEVITEMKSDIEKSNSDEYKSTLVKENSERIKRALENGITPVEVQTTLNKTLEDTNTKNGKKHLNFIVNLLSKIKRKELTRSKENEKGVQKVKK